MTEQLTLQQLRCKESLLQDNIVRLSKRVDQDIEELSEVQKRIQLLSKKQSEKVANKEEQLDLFDDNKLYKDNIDSFGETYDKIYKIQDDTL